MRVGLSIGVGLLDGFGLAMFLPLLQMTDGSAVDPQSLGNLKFLTEGMHNIGLELNLSNILTVMTIFFILKGCAKYVSSIYEINLRQFFVKSIRVKLSHALSRMQYKAFVVADAGRIQNTMSGEVNKVSQAYQNYFAAFQQGVMVAVYMLFAFFVDARFAILICLGGGLTSLAFRWVYSATKMFSKKLTKDANVYQSLILQFTTNFKYLKATGFIYKYNKKLIGVIEFIEEANRKIGKFGAIVSSTREPILILVVSAVILIQVNLMDGTLGAILISLLFFYRALTALTQMQGAYNNFLAVSGSMDNMTDFEQEIEKQKEYSGDIIFSGFSHSLELKNATFQYGERTILNEINFEICKNQTIAFVGESGSGKTTIVNILSGLMSVSKGEMTVDGVSIKEFNYESFGARVGYITQEPVVFSDTIFNNISLWASPTPENYERFRRVADQACISEFIAGLPDKEHAMLGNNGINLSGGQKQRISIARELFKDIDILVLDEATSALDSETEKSIQGNIEELQGSLTILIVAHRLSTVMKADRIVVMSAGEIIADGTFTELLETSEKFRKMVALQEVDQV